jgi:hypothetical protein
MGGVGAVSSPGPSCCFYSPNLLEEVFSEGRARGKAGDGRVSVP